LRIVEKTGFKILFLYHAILKFSPVKSRLVHVRWF